MIKALRWPIHRSSSINHFVCRGLILRWRPKNQRSSLTNVSYWTAARHEEGWYEKGKSSFSFFLVCLRKTIERWRRGGRNSGDTTGSWFQIPRVRWRNAGGAAVERLVGEDIAVPKHRKGHSRCHGGERRLLAILKRGSKLWLFIVQYYQPTNQPMQPSSRLKSYPCDPGYRSGITFRVSILSDSELIER